jgi:hypothetical protein
MPPGGNMCSKIFVAARVFKHERVEGREIAKTFSFVRLTRHEVHVQAQAPSMASAPGTSSLCKFRLRFYHLLNRTLPYLLASPMYRSA